MAQASSTRAEADIPVRFAPSTRDDDPIVRLLDEDGRRVADEDFTWEHGLDEAADALRALELCRRLDVEATSLQRQGSLGLWPPMYGQEAVQVGVHRALGEHDVVFPSYREHGLGMLMGLPVSGLLGLFKGSEMGDWDTDATRFANYAMVIGTQALHATGYAMGCAMDWRRDPELPHAATVVFHGDGATSQGDVNEAYVFAASYQAPVVFVCTNNQWAISEPSSLQSRIPLYRRAWGFGIPSVRVDGNDVPAVQAVMEWALARARDGHGPTIVEAFTYRMGAHTTSDDPTKYRTNDLTESWRRRDPILRMRTWLEAEGGWDEQRQAELTAELDAFGATVRRTCRELPEPELASAFEHVYREPHRAMVEQGEEYRAWMAGFEGDDQPSDEGQEAGR